jgi:alpha-pyrone synthase
MMNTSQLLPVIEGFATGAPEYILSQSDAAKFLASRNLLERNQHRIEKIYENTRIQTRHLAIDLLTDETIAFSKAAGTIEQRMEMYEKYAFPLADEVARKALMAARSLPDEKIEAQIGLIVFVTSTGFVAPGIDTKLIESLGLRRNIARVPVNFMGCAAAMTGLRVCCDHVKANPGSKALMVCLELSSINAVFNDDLNDIIIHSIFGDGCAAAVVGADTEDKLVGQGKFAIRDNFSYLVEDAADGITLGVKDNGITCVLSRQLPDYIQAGVGPIIKNFLATHQLTEDDINLWAIHPGGTRIIERAQLALGLDDSRVADSWEILREYGNMLSCSILFVMERMMLKMNDACLAQTSGTKADPARSVNGLAFSFSPGVGVEGILFEKI